MDKLICFSLTTEGHVAHLVMNRPEAMYTMHPTFWRKLHEVLTDMQQKREANFAPLPALEGFREFG
jgi:enoyl-CoA hydratase